MAIVFVDHCGTSATRLTVGRCITAATPSAHDFAVITEKLTDRSLEIADKSKPRSYGPERKGKGGKVKRW